MEIRKATEADIDGIEKIYDRIHDEEEAGRATIGWIRGVYPTRATALAALGRDDLFVMLDEEQVVAAAVINQVQVEEYKYGSWEHEAADSEVMVLHCLVVDPLQGGKGCGRKFVSFYEEYAKEHGCPALRMDTNERNARARALYKKLGYAEVGIVSCDFNGIPGVGLVCLEKYLG